MPLEPTTVVDLGASKLACLVGSSPEPGALRVEAWCCREGAGVVRGEILDVAAAAAVLRAALDEIEASKGITIRRVSLIAGGPELRGELRRGLHIIQPPGRAITRSDVLWAIQNSRSVPPSATTEVVQTTPCAFRVDSGAATRAPVGLGGHRLEAVTFVVEGTRDVAQKLQAVAELAGVELDALVFRPLAASSAVLDDEEAQDGVAVVDLGASSTQIAVYRDGLPVLTEFLPVGSQVVTADVSKLLNTSTSEAERLKVEAGCAMAAAVGPEDAVDILQLGHTQPRAFKRRVLAEIIESRVRELFTAVGQVLARSHEWDDLRAGVVLTGGGSQLKAIDALFEATTGLKARIGAPLPTKGPKELGRPNMAALVGAARFAAAAEDLEPIGGASDWRERVRGLAAFSPSPQKR